MIRFSKSAGFSLVELMIVVAIMAILAAIAIPSFMKFSQRAKTAEATQNVAAIRSCLESYRAENDTYLACAANPGAARTGAGAATPIAWVAGGNWDSIGFAPDGNIRYSYAVAVSVAAATPDIRNNFLITASGDIDEDTTAAVYSVDSEAATYPKPVLAPAGEL